MLLPKPVESGELQVCDKRLSSPRYLRFRDFHLDLQTQVLTNNGVRRRIVGKMYDLLTALLQNPGEIVTREVLRGQLWPGKTPAKCDANLNTTMSKLRQALGDIAEAPVFIETKLQKGYILIVQIEYVDQPAKTELPPKEKTHSQTGLAHSEFWARAGERRGGTWFAAQLIAMLIAAMLLGAAMTAYLHWPF
jgi:DNA-binding winged helix-turn-helix (wHTH) protein